MENYNIKNIVKDNRVTFERYRAGVFYYRVEVKNGPLCEFPVPVEDIGEATLLKEDKAMLFMRYIRKAIDAGTFIEV